MHCLRRAAILATVRALLCYTAARVALFAVALGLLYLLGARSWLLFLLALLFSGLASYSLLSRQRDAVAEVVGGWLRRSGQKLDAAAAAEDPAEDQQRHETG